MTCVCIWLLADLLADPFADAPHDRLMPDRRVVPCRIAPDQVARANKGRAMNMPKRDNTDVVTLQSVEAFRTIYALCDISPKTKRLKASHYATCLVAGRTPLWGVFDLDGKLIWFFESRSGLEHAPHFKHKAWRTKQCAWRMGYVIGQLDAQAKRDHLRDQRHGKKPKPPTVDNVVAFKQVA